ncbi:MAG TPA: 16S rRNA (cytosine(967)-C(5))-methyltransferase RsmB [Clostridia bacterium]|nr:16S rRNA (cytosine(967)-C(5))-methyltransferase RsmB [Clostridia bacterium]
MAVSPARSTAFDILLRVEQQDAYASELLHSERLESLSAVDRRLCMELVMGTLRWQPKLDAVIEAASGKTASRLDPEVRIALRLGAYQMQFLERVPSRAAVNESVELVKRARKRSAAPFANAVLRKVADLPAAPDTPGQDANSKELAQAYAHPHWLVERWMRRYGPVATAAICADNQCPPQATLRIDSVEVLPELEGEGIEVSDGQLVASARRVIKGDVTQTAAFREGRVAIQDEASQLVALLVGKGSRLLDCCAAPGSKTAALAVRNPEAQIVAAEIHPHRARLLQQRVRSANVTVVTSSATSLPYGAEFDRVLADVPCSGTGTLARNPEIKWKLRDDDLRDLHERQLGILEAALRHVAPGGRAVYSTCSLEPEENEEVIELALQRTPGLTIVDCAGELRKLIASGDVTWRDPAGILRGPFLRTLPGLHPCEGFFAAIIEKSA